VTIVKCVHPAPQVRGGAIKETDVVTTTDDAGRTVPKTYLSREYGPVDVRLQVEAPTEALMAVEELPAEWMREIEEMKA
jgi:hypothetical protein